MTVEALPSVFSEDGGAGGGRETALAGRVVGLKWGPAKPPRSDIPLVARSWIYGQAKGQWDH